MRIRNYTSLHLPHIMMMIDGHVLPANMQIIRVEYAYEYVKRNAFYHRFFSACE